MEGSVKSNHEVIAEWIIGEAELTEVGGAEHLAKFMVGDAELMLVGLDEEFLKRLAKHLFTDVDMKITVSRCRND